MGQELWCSLAVWFWIRVSDVVEVKMLAGAAVISRLYWGRGSFKMVHSYGCWLEASVFCYMGLCIELLEYFHNMLVGSPQREGQAKAAVPFPSAGRSDAVTPTIFYLSEVSH